MNAKRMGFNEVKRRVLASLKSGRYRHASRFDIDAKNLFFRGVMSVDELCGIIEQCRGSDYAVSPHHLFAGVDVHVLRKRGWYIKFFFVERDPTTFFISVHR